MIRRKKTYCYVARFIHIQKKKSVEDCFDVGAIPKIFTEKHMVKDIWAASWQNQQNGMCAQRRLRSAWASAQSDQSLHYPHNDTLGL